VLAPALAARAPAGPRSAGSAGPRPAPAAYVRWSPPYEQAAGSYPAGPAPVDAPAAGLRPSPPPRPPHRLQLPQVAVPSAPVEFLLGSAPAAHSVPAGRAPAGRALVVRPTRAAHPAPAALPAPAARPDQQRRCQTGPPSSQTPIARGGTAWVALAEADPTPVRRSELPYARLGHSVPPGCSEWWDEAGLECSGSLPDQELWPAAAGWPAVSAELLPAESAPASTVEMHYSEGRRVAGRRAAADEPEFAAHRCHELPPERPYASSSVVLPANSGRWNPCAPDPAAFPLRPRRAPRSACGPRC
jgi:hypothetical protein